MTIICSKIRTAIIDDDEEFLYSLKNNLSFFPEIEIVGCATKYKQARSLMQNNGFDLLFLDIEMPGKNGFELLQESHELGKDDFGVIFHTAYDKYAIRALQESAIDYIIKPVKPDELKNAIERFKKKRKVPQKSVVKSLTNNYSEITSLPTATGIRFLEKGSILLFQWGNGSYFDKKCWTAILTDRSEIKMRSGTSAKDILDFLGTSRFIRINPSLILNIGYLATIEYSTRECLLIPPFNNIPITVSRSNMAEIRVKFDLL